MHPADLRIDPIDASEAIRQLVELGYMPAPSGEESNAMESPCAEVEVEIQPGRVAARRRTRGCGAAAHRRAAREAAGQPALHDAPRAMLRQSPDGDPADVRRIIETAPKGNVSIGTGRPVARMGGCTESPATAKKRHPRIFAAPRAQATPDSPVIHCMIGPGLHQTAALVRCRAASFPRERSGDRSRKRSRPRSTAWPWRC